MGWLKPGTPVPELPPKVELTLNERKRNKRSGRSAVNKGKSAEREVVKRYKAHGYENAMRQPGSGSLRVEQGISPMPGDIRAVAPWGPVEVKHTVATDRPGRGGMRGASFLRAVCKAEWKLYLARPVGVISIPVVWARTDRAPWRIFLPEPMFLALQGISAEHDPPMPSWVELTEDAYWALDDARKVAGQEARA